MASRKKLKHTIQFVASELIVETYMRCLISGSFNAEKIEQLVCDIVSLSKEFKLRVNRPDGKNNSKLVKAYYNNLFESWQTESAKIIARIDELSA